MTSSELEALGAFLSGAGSVIGGFWVIRRIQRQAAAACDSRIKELHEEYDRGLDRGIRLEEGE